MGKSIILLFVLATISLRIDGQNIYNFKTPEDEILKILDIQQNSQIKLSGNKNYAIICSQNLYLSIDEIAKPETKLAGLVIDTLNLSLCKTKHFNKISLVNLITGKKFDIRGIDSKDYIDDIYWSPNNKYVAFCKYKINKIELWYFSIDECVAKMLHTPPLNAVFGSPYRWHPNSFHIIYNSTFNNQSQQSKKKLLHVISPSIYQSDTIPKPTRTYQNLLSSNEDDHLFERISTTKLSVVDLRGKKTNLNIGPGIFTYFDYSPNGKYLLIKCINKPYSHTLPWYRFSQTTSIYNRSGLLIKELIHCPILDNVLPQRDAVSEYKREYNWRSDKGAMVYWVEAQDKGAPNLKVDYRDKVYILEEPFSQNPVLLFTCKLRYNRIFWCNDTVALVHERLWNNRKAITSKINPSNPKQAKSLFEYSTSNQQLLPGFFQTKINTFGKEILDVFNNQFVPMLGRGYTDKGDYPFIDLLSFKNDNKFRFWQNKSEKYEEPIVLINTDPGTILLSSETSEIAPDFYKLETGTNIYTSITKNPKPYDGLNKVTTIHLTAKRSDGVELNGDLFLPPGHNEQNFKKLPMLLWAYPLEFKNKIDASQHININRRFMYLPALPPLPLVYKGYAVLLSSMPIVSDSSQYVNDSYIEQIIDNSSTIIKKAISVAPIDSSKIAVAGHSYGASMVANLLTYTNFFKTGIAMSGAYNRSLTPFGFQSETRNYWQVPMLYDRLSPFRNADKMKFPILLTHGEYDNNLGTSVIQSERYFQALKGLGNNTRLIIFPYEGHSYQAKESLLHLFWEINAWLDKFLK